MRLKDRFLTHGGLALWTRKHKWCGCLSVPLCWCPPPSSSSSSIASSSPLPLFHSSLHCTPCPCHSLFPSSFPIRRAAGARGLSDGFHGYWLQRLDTSSQLPVVVRQPDIHCYQAGLFSHSHSLSLRPSAKHLCPSLPSPSNVWFSYVHLHFLESFSSPVCSFLILVFLLALCPRSQVRRQPRLIWVHWDNNYSSNNQPRPKSACWMPLAPLLGRSITLSENLFRTGGINPAQNAIHRARFARQSEEKRLIDAVSTPEWCSRFSLSSLIYSIPGWLLVLNTL